MCFYPGIRLCPLYIHAGCDGEILRNESIIKYNRATIITMDKMFIPRPALAIWGIVS